MQTMAATKLPEVSTRLAVVYFSQTNSTHQITNAVITGMTHTSGTMTFQYRIRGSEIHGGRFQNQELLQQLQTCHGIVFGTPTYMGSISAQFKAFADATSELWAQQSLAGKMAGGFTCGASINGDQGTTINYLMTLASQHGMLWAGLDAAAGYHSEGINRLGCQSGVVAHIDEGQIHPADLASAEYLGARIAKQARLLNAAKELT